MTIRILAPQVQQRIAAGEVIERPASVLKELIENALDAGAQSVRVEVQEGGRRLIQVTDDGAGIAAEEMPLAFARFATSKITQAEDLSAIQSFGFRGEALAGIASVARVRCLTRTRDALLGTEARLEAGRVVSLSESGAPIGTRMEVWDLFYNVPARRKFLRSLQTEYRHILNTFTTFALAFPDRHFSLSLDGRDVYTLAPAAPAERIGAMFGQGLAAQLESFDEIGPWGRVWGYVVSQESQRRGHLFVNRRPVRNLMLYRAVREGLQEMSGLTVLFLEFNPAEIDVNVHPAKTEVRFRQEHEVYERVRHALRRRQRAFNSGGLQAAEEEAVYGDEAGGFQLLGQLQETFLLVLHDRHLYLLDQHAAEERVFYERLQQGGAGRRDLIAPQVVTLSAEDRTFVDAHAQALTACGFVLEPFGPQVLALRAVPGCVHPKESAHIFLELLAHVRSGREDFTQALACLSAVKAGTVLSPEAQARLLAGWTQTANPHACAHNRPTYFRVSLDEVRRKVGRTGLSCEFDQNR